MLYAHLNKFIDLNKDIDPNIEHVILNYIESIEIFRTVSAYPLVAESTGQESDQIYLPNKEWIKPVTSCILPWLTDKSDETQTQLAADDKIARWRAINKGIITDGR